MEAAWVFLATFAFKVLGIFPYMLCLHGVLGIETVSQKSKFPEWAGQGPGIGYTAV